MSGNISPNYGNQVPVPRSRGILAEHADDHNNAIDLAQRLANDMSILANKLVGPEPEPLGRTAPAGPPVPEISYVHSYAGRNTAMREALARIEAAYSRINSAL